LGAVAFATVLAGFVLAAGFAAVGLGAAGRCLRVLVYVSYKILEQTWEKGVKFSNEIECPGKGKKKPQDTHFRSKSTCQNYLSSVCLRANGLAWLLNQVRVQKGRCGVFVCLQHFNQTKDYFNDHGIAAWSISRFSKFQIDPGYFLSRRSVKQ
jgi:hypothetical protein